MSRWRVTYHFYSPAGVTEPFSLHRCRLAGHVAIWRNARRLTHGNRSCWSLTKESQ